MINEQIRDKEVRVISETGEQLGVMTSKEAMKLARGYSFARVYDENGELIAIHSKPGVER
jgi:translation initiation factor IF-3